ncbi:MAG: hypothetical protein ABSG26_18525 [Bryobacteraceae bacterium]
MIQRREDGGTVVGLNVLRSDGTAGGLRARQLGAAGPVVKASGGSHEGNFIECIKTRQKPNSDIEIGRLSTMLCHLGNISYKLHRPVDFDPKTETFPNDKEADRLLTKQYRPSYGLPEV